MDRILQAMRLLNDEYEDTKQRNFGDPDNANRNRAAAQALNILSIYKNTSKRYPVNVEELGANRDPYDERNYK